MVKTQNEIRMEKARSAIEELWTDQSVSIEEKLANLTALIEEIEIIMDGLRSEVS